MFNCHLSISALKSWSAFSRLSATTSDSVCNYIKKTNIIPVGNYMFKVKNRHTRTRCEICSKLTVQSYTVSVHMQLLIDTLRHYCSALFPRKCHWLVYFCQSDLTRSTEKETHYDVFSGKLPTFCKGQFHNTSGRLCVKLGRPNK